MKYHIRISLVIALIIFNAKFSMLHAQVGINDNNTSPDASAMLDVKSTSKGMLIPRMTTTNRNNINSPATGLMIYNTTTNAFNFYNGAAWIEIKSGRTKTISDADNDTKIQVEEGADEDSIRFDIKGTERLVLRQNNHNMTMLNLPNNNYNILIGQDAGLNTQLGTGDQGKYNQFIGYLAGHKNTTGSKNLFLGPRAGYSNTTGVINTFIGFEAGKDNTTGNFNFFLGESAGKTNTTGSSNLFLGGGAGQANTTASNNLFIGSGAGISTTTGGNNTFIGRLAGASNTTGSANIFLGYNAGLNETGSNKLYIDNSNTSSPLIYGEFDNNKVEVNGSFQVDNNSARIADFNNTTSGGAYIEVNNTVGTRALFGPDGTGFTGGSTSDVVIGNWSNGGLKIFANAIEKINISKYGLVEIKDTLKIRDGSQGTGKVLTSDANGVATWTNPTVNTDNQTLDVAQLNGTNLELSLSNDGQATKSIDLSSLNSTKALIADVDNDTKIQVEASADEDKMHFTIGGSTRLQLEKTASGATVLHLPNNNRNTTLGTNAGMKNTTGVHNVTIGRDAGEENTTGYANTMIGHGAGEKNTTGAFNTFVGQGAGNANTTSFLSTYIGSNAGIFATGANNVAIGASAGEAVTGSHNVFIGTNTGRYLTNVSHQLHISNSSSKTLIYGEFNNDLVRINGTLNINDEFSFPTTDGTAGQILTTDGSGTLTWADENTVEAEQSLTYAANYGNYPSPFDGVKFYKENGRVYLEGMARKNATIVSGDHIGTLPVGYRPSHRSIFAVAHDTGVMRCDIFTNGEIYVYGTPTTDWVSFSGASFRSN